MKPVFNSKIGIFLALVLLTSFCFQKENQNDQNDQLIIKYKNSNKLELLNIDKNLTKTKQSLKQNNDIEILGYNNKYYITSIPNDPSFSSQNYLKQINADLAWTFSSDAKDITVAVIDTGIDLNHSELKDNIWKNDMEIPDDNIDNDGNGFVDDIYGWDFVNNTNDVGIKISRGYKTYAVNHGTVVAGIIGAVGDNKEGITGVTWNVKLMSIRAINSQGEGNTYDISRAIYYAIRNKADIINLSFVGNENDPILADAIRKASNANIAIVASAGNEINPGINLDESPRYPVCYDFNKNTVFGVGSVNDKNILSVFSNYGTNCIDILAPGENFISTQAYYPSLYDFQTKYGINLSGTSLSAPLVSGAIALIKSIDKSLTNQEIYQILKNSAKNIGFINFTYRKQIGAGLLDVNKALIETRALKNSKHLNIVAVPRFGNINSIKLFDRKTGINTEVKISLPLGAKNKNNYYTIKSGDINGDNNDEIILASTNNSGTYISIYDQKLSMINNFKLNYNKPISMEIMDAYLSGREKIIIGSPSGYEAKISIYDQDGTLLNSFKTYNSNSKFGLSITKCDIDGDYKDEIITVPKKGGGPHVIYYTIDGQIKDSFFAGNKDFRGGLNIACGDTNNDDKNEIILTPETGGSSYSLIYNTDKNLISSFWNYDSKFNKEASLNLIDIDNDYKKEIAVNTNQGASPHVRIFDAWGNLKDQFFAFDQKQKNGVSLTSFIKKEDAKNN